MARKHKKLLSTLRALEDKQEPPSNQRELEEKSVPAPLNLAAAESEPEPQAPEVASHELIAPLLTPSLLEEQLSELTTVPVVTAESLHIADITTPTEAEAVETETPAEAEAVETEAPIATTTEADQEPVEPSPDEAIAEREPESQPEAETHSAVAPTQPASAISEESEEFSAPELDSTATIISTEPSPTALQTPQTASAVADPITTQPTHSLQAVAERLENPEQQAEAGQPAIAMASKATFSKAELLKRPEAFAVIVFATLSSLWQAYVDLWAKPDPKHQRPSHRSARH